MSFEEEKHEIERKELIREQLSLNGYDLLDPIGNGGFATCYTIRSRKYEQIFVAKVMDIKRKADESMPRSFHAEIDSLVNIIHPNVINIFNYFICEAGLILILEYCPGGTLTEYIKNNGPIQPPKIFYYCKQLLSALQAIHTAQISHHDIKPSNILLDQYNRPKLADFGLARHIKEGFSNKIVGSLPFMPPEAFKKEPYDEFKADIWSLGVTFYVMGAGILPWSVANKSDFIRQISAGYIDYSCLKFFDPMFNELLRCMLEPNPLGRATVEEILKMKLFKKRNSDVEIFKPNPGTTVSLSQLPSLKPLPEAQRNTSRLLKSSSSKGLLKMSSAVFSTKKRRTAAFGSFYVEPTIPSILAQ